MMRDHSFNGLKPGKKQFRPSAVSAVSNEGAWKLGITPVNELYLLRRIILSTPPTQCSRFYVSQQFFICSPIICYSQVIANNSTKKPSGGVAKEKLATALG